MTKPRFVTLVGMIVFAALCRVVPHPWNATPVAAMALFAGAQFSDRKAAFFVPLAALFVSDMVLGFYPTMAAQYAGFAIAVLIGRSLQNNKTIMRIAAGALTASVVFFVITNFVCWLTMPEYTKDLAGLFTCYERAVPFFRNTLSGDMFFTAVLFGSFSLSEKAFPQLRATATAA